MRRLVAAVLLLAAVPAVPAAAQSSSFATYSGCNVYFCTLLAETVTAEPYDNPEMPDVPFLYSYWVTGRVTFTPHATALGVSWVLGTIYLPLSEEYDAGLPLNVSPTWPTFEGGVSGARRPVPPITGLTAEVSDDVFYPDGTSTSTFSDLVENGLVVTPEPATSALLATGLVAALWARRRRAHS